MKLRGMVAQQLGVAGAVSADGVVKAGECSVPLGQVAQAAGGEGLVAEDKIE